MKVTGKLMKTEKGILALAAVFLVVLALMRLGASRRAAGTDYTVTPQRVQEAAREELIDINTAGAEELETLNGIGPSLAQRIIDHREANGPFQSVDDLLKVSGIGRATLDKFRNHIAIGAVLPDMRGILLKKRSAEEAAA